ncbi:hypothetical protein FQN49_000006 [Arthroderma sp. PD_2]|nr:hypothetical protein FQN49_000006 [Arthroderma sp. PD_2]
MAQQRPSSNSTKSGGQMISYSSAGETRIAGSSTCVANASPIPLLAPLTNDSICPLRSKERWEIRTRPFGCGVSTALVLTSIISAISTLALVAVGYAAYQMWTAKKKAEEEQQRQAAEDVYGEQYGGGQYGPYRSGGGYGGVQYGDGGGGGFGEGIGGMVVPGIMGAVGGGISNWMGQGQGQVGAETIQEEDEEDENSPLL